MTHREQLLSRRKHEPTRTAMKTAEIDLGLAVLTAVHDGRPMTQVDIAEVCGCTPERIRQIEEIALLKLRRDCRSLALYFDEICNMNQKERSCL